AGTNAAIKTELRHVPTAARWYGTSMMRWKEGTCPLVHISDMSGLSVDVRLLGVKRTSLARPRNRLPPQRIVSRRRSHRSHAPAPVLLQQNLHIADMSSLPVDVRFWG